MDRPETREPVVKFGPFTAGVNNVAPDHALPEGAVRDLVNVDVTNSGTLVRRSGYTQSVAGTQVISAWSDGSTGYIVDNGTLRRLTPGADGSLLAEAVTNTGGAVFNAGVAMCKTPTQTLLSDTRNLFYLDGLVLRKYDVPAPGILTTSGGTDGEFLLCTTTVLDDGSESAPSPVQRVSGGYPLTVTCSTNSRTIYLYASALNGKTLHRVGDISSGTLTTSSGYQDGVPLHTANLSYLPAGTALRFGYGRVFSTVGQYVFFSEPYYFNLYNGVKNVLAFPDDVTVFEVLTDAFLVATAKEVGIVRGANLDQSGYTQLLPYGAVKGSAVQDARGGFAFMTEYGQCYIDLAGQVTQVHRDKVAVEKADTGASAILTQNGIQRTVSALFNGAFSGTVASSFLDAEIIRKGRASMITENYEIGFTYTVEHLRGGVVIDSETVHNIVPTVGMNHFLDVVFRSASAYANWYIALYEGNYTPVANDTMSTIVSNSTETTAYDESTREAFTTAAASGGVISNTANKAEFTMNATKTIYGGFITSGSTKSSTSGMLISAVKFSSPKSVVDNDVLRVTAGITLTSS